MSVKRIFQETGYSLSSFFSHVFGLASLGLIGTGLSAYVVGKIAYYYISSSSLFILVLLSLIASSILEYFTREAVLTGSLSKAIVLFGATSLVGGFCYPYLYIIGKIIGMGILISAFVGTFCIFSISAIYGYFSDGNLERVESILKIGFISILALSFLKLILWFIAPGIAVHLSFLISVALVVLVSIFISSKIRDLKYIYYHAQGNNNLLARASIIGAMNLYSSFLLLFISILNILLYFRRKD